MLLSCSVTHPSLSKIAKQYVEFEIFNNLSLKHLTIAVFSEQECLNILDEAFHNATDDLKNVFGVDGAYGRHYTFLKSVSALWQKAVVPTLKGTFKIDLDQVFPQNILIAETGLSAFEHFKTTKWGADAIDSQGKPVHLGMIAGGLVNESDIHKGLFTSDVGAPAPDNMTVFEQMFCSRWPQALSTQAEILSQSVSSQRVHVTGGTNGILIDALYQFRPFTPTFIHRAEDQAFILSGIASATMAKAEAGNVPYLGYYHQPGLIMRHDKNAFAKRSMALAEAGKDLGDIERVLLFSAYAKHHPANIPHLKQLLFPFTSCFISETPTVLAVLRFLLEGTFKPTEFTDTGAIRLAKCFAYCHTELNKTVESNQQGWNEYYDRLTNDKLSEQAIRTIKKSIISG